MHLETARGQCMSVTNGQSPEILVSNIGTSYRTVREWTQNGYVLPKGGVASGKV